MTANIKITCLVALLTFLPKVYADNELFVYSSKNASYITPLFDEYSRETGVAVRYLVSSAPSLISRIETESDDSKADLLLVAGAANFWQASEKGLLSVVQSKTLERNVPSHFRSTQKDWFAFSKRAQAIVYNPEYVSESELNSYSGLASPKWRENLCLRRFNDEYTQSLIAMLVGHSGEDRTALTLDGWIANLAMSPLKDDLEVIEAIDNGLCDVGIINAYYYARFKREKTDTALKLFWPDQTGHGVQMDITGLGVIKNAPNKEQAIDFMEWLTTKSPQVLYAKLSMEYPINKKVYPAREVAKWGKFKEDNAHVANTGIYRNTALKLIEKASF